MSSFPSRAVACLIALGPIQALAGEPEPSQSAAPAAAYPVSAPSEPAPQATTPADPPQPSPQAPNAAEPTATPPAPAPPAASTTGTAPYILPPAPLDQPPPEEPRHRRSSFYASLGVGPGLFRATSGSTGDRRSFSGGTVSGRVALGAQLSRVALGGAFYYDHVYALSSEDEVIDGDEPSLKDRRFTLSGLAFFTNVALADDRRPYLELSFGFGSLGTSRAGSTDDPGGPLLGVGAGYEILAGEHTALGLLARLTYAPFSVNEGGGGTKVETFVPALLLTGTAR
jgi:hypothetical protein